MITMYVFLGVFGCNGKVWPLDRSENCTGVRGLEDKLMTHLLLVVESPVVVVLVAVCPSPLLFAGRIPLVVLSSIEFNGGYLCELDC